MKKGFTLIELLAVIVILAIIALIATPIVLNVINDVKKSATLRSAEFYLNAVEQSIMKKNMNEGGSFSPNICEVQSDGNLLCDGTDTLEVETNGEKPSSGTITFEKGKINNILLNLGNKNIVKNYKGELALIPEPKSFREDSWETIVANVKVGNLSKYKVGDTKEIALTGFTNTETGSNGLYTIRIANITNTGDVCTKEYLEREDGTKERYSKTACGFVIEFEDNITTHKMNNSSTSVGGYPASSMYTYIQNNIYKCLPDDLKDVIIPTYVVSGHVSTSGEENFVTEEDKLYLLSGKEVYGMDTLDTSADLTRQLDYYSNIGVTTSNYSGAIKKLNGGAKFWWLRSAYSIYTGYFRGVDNDGILNNSNAINAYGVAVAFRIG